MNIEIKGLTKNYGNKTALDNVDLKIDKGMFGLLGPNGAGKTTLMRILTTLVQKTEGDINIQGIDISKKRKIRQMIGYLPQDFAVYPTLTVYEAMDYLALLSNIAPKSKRKKLILDLLEKVNLEDHLKTKVKALSGGMKRRLGIAQALINNPSLLIVDEPTAGLDPEERIRFRNLLRDFSEDRIVILSTHIVEDVEFTCEDLAILKEGQILYKGKSRDLIKQAEGYIWTANLDRKRLNDIRKNHHIISTVSEGDLIKTRFLSDGTPIEESKAVSPSIEDAYMKLVKGV
ncbi:ABC transporter ATP-binding protein [Clostridium sp. D2Q-11]|uniref:ABC transporter ATP-binding protein n=1 Tax=Anaeromonas frigoriresistens TaxID=2683708 RepID=A0A942UWU3_9FIRM|nr:ABC transporter ATP-binding protein [Anaeromonas frigoriresistens]MBS4539020.1 ABC transporter ATP-binding protein [Anaeromonas frigoriresistens]